MALACYLNIGAESFFCFLFEASRKRLEIENLSEARIGADNRAARNTRPRGSMRAWIEVDGALIEGHFESSPTASDEIALWLKETSDGVHAALSHLVDGVLPDNVVDARSCFLRGRGKPREVLSP